MLLLYPQRLVALHDGWQASTVPEKTAAVMQKPVYDSAVDSVKPAAVQAAREVSAHWTIVHCLST